MTNSPAPTKRPNSPVFDCDRRIRLGIWGLGRGMSFFACSRTLNIDVVAGCDWAPHLREGFLAANPGAFVTNDIDAMLARSDVDAVLVATFCPSHADDCIRCLRAGKHVLSEVTAFHTMAEGVRLVEEVERTGKVYNLAENYPFSAANMWLAEQWRKGLFGKLQYAEYEYVHEVRSLQYTYLDGTPITPGHEVHTWRSWLNYHYYCTHSLGPVMIITGERPTRVVALPAGNGLPGYIGENAVGLRNVAPSLITMSGGGLVRNLMGATSSDGHVQRLWGTKGGAEQNVGAPLTLRLGGSGNSPRMVVSPEWSEHGKLAEASGHGGGDFWMMYYFARQILFGDPAPFDIHTACDVTIPGILAARSAAENGRPYDVPDFRDAQQREPWRNDQWALPRFDTHHGVFGKGEDVEHLAGFSSTMANLINSAQCYRAWVDWDTIATAVQDKTSLLNVGERLLKRYPQLQIDYADARRLIDAAPEGSPGQRVLTEMLVDVGEEQKALSPGFLPSLERRLSTLRLGLPALSSAATGQDKLKV